SPRAAPLVAVAFLSSIVVLPGQGEEPRTDLYGDPLPAHAIARLGTVRLRPGHSHYCSDISPDGRTLITSEEWGVVRLWDTATGKEIRSVKLPQGIYMLDVGFSPDGRSFFAHTDNLYIISRPPWDEHSIHVGDVATGKLHADIKGAGFTGVA